MTGDRPRPFRIGFFWCDRHFTLEGPEERREAGHLFADYFRDHGAWLGAEYRNAAEAIAAARNQYRGRDADGFGIVLEIQREDEYPRHHALDDDHAAPPHHGH